MITQYRHVALRSRERRTCRSLCVNMQEAFEYPPEHRSAGSSAPSLPQAAGLDGRGDVEGWHLVQKIVTDANELARADQG